MGRKFGQHFLRDHSVLERIAQAVCPEGEQVGHVVEIGPGRGALTRHLLRRCTKLTAIEVDPVMVERLRGEFGGEEKFTLVHEDVLKVDLGAYGPCVIAGNLPYYISSPIVSRVFAAAGAWKRAVFLVQKEVALRMAAQKGSRDYGYLSVLVRTYSEPELLFGVGPGAFTPPPKVDSAVIALRPKVVAREEAARLMKFVARAFAHKRKTLRNNLAPFYGKARIEAQPEANLRAEQLSPEDLAGLERRLSGGDPVLS